MIARELAHALLVAGALAAVLALAERLRGRLGAEASRKLVHFGCGLPAAAFPWLFASAWSVAGLCAGFAALLAWTARTGRLRSVHGVPRRGGGELLYPAAVGLVFVLARSHPAAYVASILVLAAGDAAAALVGGSVGRNRYRTPGGTRSVEGSLAFFVVALPCIGVPLHLLTPLPLVSVVVWSGLVAALGCGLEALAPGGSDNLLVPAGCCLALLPITPGAATDARLLLLPVAALAVLSLGLTASPRRCARTP